MTNGPTANEHLKRCISAAVSALDHDSKAAAHASCTAAFHALAAADVRCEKHVVLEGRRQIKDAQEMILALIRDLEGTQK